MAEKPSSSPVLFWVLAVLAALLALPLILMGAIFVLSAFHPDAAAVGKTAPRLLVGAGICAPGLLIVLLSVLLVRYAMRARGEAQEGSEAGVQGVPGPLSMKAVTCPHCGGQVDPSSATLGPEGTLTMTCGYCKGVFMVQEDPKW